MKGNKFKIIGAVAVAVAVTVITVLITKDKKNEISVEELKKMNESEMSYS